MFCSFNTCFHQMCSHQTWELWKYWRRKEAWSKILVFLLCRLWLQWVSPSPHSVPKPRQPRRGWDTQCVLWHWIHVHHSIHLLWSSEFFSALSKLSAALWLMTGSNSITNSLFYHHRHSHSSARPIFLWKYSFFFVELVTHKDTGAHLVSRVGSSDLHISHSFATLSDSEAKLCPPHYKYIFVPIICSLQVLWHRGWNICARYYN